MAIRRKPEAIVEHLIKRSGGDISKRLAIELKKTVKDLREVQGFSDSQIRAHLRTYISDHRFISKAERSITRKKKVK